MMCIQYICVIVASGYCAFVFWLLAVTVCLCLCWFVLLLSSDMYSVLDHAARAHVDTESFPPVSSDTRLSQAASKSSAKFLFMLALLENHQKKQSEYLLACKTESVLLDEWSCAPRFS